ncbi:MAG: hypothetical protein FJZ63_01690 [Chlamydiae bacterium]|nr:hypothetical protein [Chlamydiota bacterium]
MASVVLKPGVNGVAPMGAAASSDALTAKVTSIVQGIFKKIKLLAIFCGVGCLALVGLYFTVHYPVRVVMTAISVGVLYKAIAPSLTIEIKLRHLLLRKQMRGAKLERKLVQSLLRLKRKTIN